MARAYGDDLRRKVLEAYAAGEGAMHVLALRFRVSKSWVKNIRTSQRLTGQAERVLQSRNGPRSRVNRDQVRAMVLAEPDITLGEIVSRLAKTGTTISQSQVWRVVDGLGLRRKKSRSTPPSATRKPTSSGANSSSRSSVKPRRKT